MKIWDRSCQTVVYIQGALSLWWNLFILRSLWMVWLFVGLHQLGDLWPRLRHLWHWLCLEVTEQVTRLAGWRPPTLNCVSLILLLHQLRPWVPCGRLRCIFPSIVRAYGVILRSCNISTHARSSAARTVVRYRMRYVKCSAIPNIAIKPLCILRIDWRIVHQAIVIRGSCQASTECTVNT